jgi:hypothetical protein
MYSGAAVDVGMSGWEKIVKRDYNATSRPFLIRTPFLLKPFSAGLLASSANCARF